MCVCARAYVCICVWVWVYFWICPCVCVCVRVCIRACVRVSVQVLLPMLNARGISTVVHAAGALNRNDTEGLQVTFATYAGLFCHIRRPLLP